MKVVFSGNRAWFPVAGVVVALLLLSSCHSSVREAAPSLSVSGETWSAGDGKRFGVSVVRPLEEADGSRSAWILVHGFGGAGSDFAPLATVLAERGAWAYAPNLRGMGTDPEVEDRGHIGSAEEWVRDLEEFRALVEERHPDVPLFLVGESLGAAIVTEWAARQGTATEIAGLVLLSPVPGLAPESEWWQRQVFGLMNRLRPRHRISLEELAGDASPATEFPVSSLEERQAEIAASPHRLDSLSLRFLAEMLALLERQKSNGAAVAGMPVWIAHGGRDLFVREPAEVETLAEAFRGAGNEVEVVFFPEGHHLLLYDHLTPEVLAALLEWSGRRPRGVPSFQIAPSL